MNPNWLGVVSAILAFVAFFVVHRSANRLSTKSRVLIALLALLAAVPAASFAVYYAHVLPEPSWYYQFRSIAGTELLMVFIGIAGGLVATLMPRNLLGIPLLGVAAFSIAPIIKPFFEFNPGFSPEDGLPAVVGVRLGSIGHFIAVLGQEGDNFVIGDPLRGREMLTRDELEQRYDFTAFHMTINRKGEHDGTGKPATRSESKSEDGQTPELESDGRSR